MSNEKDKKEEEKEEKEMARKADRSVRQIYSGTRETRYAGCDHEAHYTTARCGRRAPVPAYTQDDPPQAF